MDKQDWPRFCKLIQASDEVTAGKPRSEAALALMFRALEEHSFADVERAVSEHIASSPFVVKPADVVRLISGSAEERSGVAWRVFLDALDRYAYYNSVVFLDPAYHYVIMQFGGWERISHEYHQLSEKEIHFRGAEWRRLYEIGLRKAAWDSEPGKVQVPRYLCGFWERDNREGGYLEHLPEVVEIGTGRKIKQEALVSGKGNVIELTTGTDGAS